MGVASVPQTFGKNDCFKGFGGEMSLYDNLRSSVPVIDAAIGKIVRLTGGFNVECEDSSAQDLLSDFLENVPVGGNMTGISSFIDSFLDQLLTFGTALGEIVPYKDFSSFALFNGDLRGITLKRSSENPLDILVLSDSRGTMKPADNQNLILLSVLDPEPGCISGNSVLKGLPFVSAVLMQIFSSIGANWERMGNLRYSVTYRPQNDAFDKAYAKDRAQQIAKGWSDAMKSGGEVKDFIAVGDVDIKVIGADNQILDSEVPVRQLLEQIVAKTGLPPFMLGLNWSTTERMAQQQTDLLTSELWHYRRILTPVIMKIAKTFLNMKGLDSRCRVVWDEISLLDRVEQAKALYYNAQAEKYHAEAMAAGSNGEVN